MLEPTLGVTKKEVFNKNNSIDSNATEIDKVKIVNPLIDDNNIIPSVFLEDVTFESDAKVMVKALDAFAWEKKSLSKIYKKKDQIWTKQGIKEFKKILSDDRYLSLCGDIRYLQNLEFTTQKIEQDVLYSVLFLKYLNNLSSGCIEWVSSDGSVLNENHEENIASAYLLEMLSRGVLVERLFLPYLPQEKDFTHAIKRYKALDVSAADRNEIKLERLVVEQYKSSESYPEYD